MSEQRKDCALCGKPNYKFCPCPWKKPFDEWPARQLSKTEAREAFDASARKNLNISGEEFLRRWDAGEFSDPDTPEIMRVAMLIPFGR